MPKMNQVKKAVCLGDSTVQKLRVLRSMLLALTGPSGIDGLPNDDVYTLMDNALSQVNDVLKTISRETNKTYVVSL